MTLTFADLLQAFRARAKLSKKRLAELAQVDRNRLADWEAGKRVPRDYSVVQDLAEQLGLSIEERKQFEAAYTAARALRVTSANINSTERMSDERRNPNRIQSEQDLTMECETPIIHGFGEVWSRSPGIRRLLGCPPTLEDTEKATETIIQFFEQGIMLWLFEDGEAQGRGVVYILINEGQICHRTTNIMPVFKGITNDIYLEHISPIDMIFEGIYWRSTGWELKRRLGGAIKRSERCDGVYQRFKNGRMFWISLYNDIYVLWEESDSQQKLRKWQRFKNVRW